MLIPNDANEASYRYGGTYLTYGNDVILVNEGYDGGFVGDDPRNGDPIEVDFEDIDFIYPTLGLINSTQSVVWTARSTGRGYKRGYSPSDITTSFIGDINVQQRFIQGTVQNIIRVLLPYYPSLDESIERVMAGNYIGRAWSPRFAVVKMQGYEALGVFYNNALRGYHHDGKFFIPSEYDHIAEELTEYTEEVEILL